MVRNLHRWMQSEVEIVRCDYRGAMESCREIAERLSKPGDIVTPLAVRGVVIKLGLARIGKPEKNGRAWTEADLAYLAENYGRVTDERLARKLGRTVNGIKLGAKRLLKLNRKMNIYTAREVAKIIGVGCSKTIIHWMKKGFIQGKRGVWRQGSYKVWAFEYEDIEQMIRKYPWLPHLAKMENHDYFKSIISEEYERDPWYTCDETAAILDLKTHDAVQRYIFWGMLHAVKKPGGPYQGVWIIRKSDIDRFLASGSREEHRLQARKAYFEDRRKQWYESGRPVHLYSMWLIRCPACGRRVRVKSEKTVASPKVKEMFARTFITEDGCRHGKSCIIYGTSISPETLATEHNETAPEPVREGNTI